MAQPVSASDYAVVMRTTIVAALLSLPLLALTLPAQDLAFKRAADYSKEKDGLAVLVSHKGKTVFERYANGHDADKAKHIWSGTKSFAPMMAFAAQAEGLLKLDEFVADTITEWADDPRKKKITIRHLLSFTSGISQKSSYSRSDIYKSAVMAETKADPGKRFKYGSNHLRVFGELMKRKLATRLNTQQKNAPRDALAYLRQRILDPIGCEFGKWTRDKSKNPNLAYGAYVTARNWVKFGHLVLNKGRCGDRQVVPSDYLHQCFVGTRTNPTYGLNWWLIGGGLHRRNAAVPKDTVAAKGLFGQMLYVIPSRDLVIVRFGKDRSRKGFSDAAFLGRLFGRGAARTGEASTRREKISQEQRAGSSDVKAALVPPAPGSTTITVGDASTTRLIERDHDGAGASRNDPEVELAQLP